MLSEMKNKEFEAKRRKYQVLPNFGHLLQGARGTQNYDFSGMRAQFLLFHTFQNSSKFFKISFDTDF